MQFWGRNTNSEIILLNKHSLKLENVAGSATKQRVCLFGLFRNDILINQLFFCL